MNRLTGLISIFDRILAWFFYIAGAFIVFIMLSVTVDIILRKVFSAPLHWVDEVSGYLLVYVTFLGSAWLLRNQKHVSVGIVIENVDPKIRALVGAITSFLIAAVCLVLTYFGVIATWEQHKNGIYTVSVLEWPVAPLVSVIPFGSFLLFIQLLRGAYGYLVTLGSQKGPNEEHREF
jgi:TRAP-type C4-dicarboxylate transport system permease small subunit